MARPASPTPCPAVTGRCRCGRGSLWRHTPSPFLPRSPEAGRGWQGPLGVGRARARAPEPVARPRPPAKTSPTGALACARLGGRARHGFGPRRRRARGGRPTRILGRRPAAPRSFGGGAQGHTSGGRPPTHRSTRPTRTQGPVVRAPSRPSDGRSPPSASHPRIGPRPTPQPPTKNPAPSRDRNGLRRPRPGSEAAQDGGAGPGAPEGQGDGAGPRSHAVRTRGRWDRPSTGSPGAARKGKHPRHPRRPASVGGSGDQSHYGEGTDGRLPWRENLQRPRVPFKGRFFGRTPRDVPWPERTGSSFGRRRSGRRTVRRDHSAVGRTSHPSALLPQTVRGVRSGDTA